MRGFKRQFQVGLLITGILLITVQVQGRAPVRFVGTKPVCVSEISRIVASSEADEEAVAQVRQKLADAGYLDAEVLLGDSVVTVTSGRRFGVREIQVKGDTDTVAGVSLEFDRNMIERRLSALLDHFRRNGYYYARLEPLSLALRGDSVEVSYRLDKGPVMTAEGYSYSGLTRSDSGSVGRFLPDLEGQTITPGMLREVADAAKEVDYLKFEGGPEVKPSPGFQAARLGLRFAERNPLLLEGGLGYQSDIEEFVWNLRLKLVNLFGTGRQAEINSSRPDIGRTILNIRYRQPMFLLGGGYASLRLFTRDYRESFYEFGVSAGYEWNLNHHFKGTAALEWKRVDPADSIASYTRTGLTLAATRSTVEGIANPISGTRLAWNVAYHHRRFHGADSIDIGPFDDTQTRLEIERWQTIASPVGMRGNFVYETLISNDPDLPVSELILVGGPGSIRGYRNEQFAVTTALTATIEPYLRFDAGRIAVFYDAAYMFEPIAENVGSNDSRELYRFGFGLAFGIVGVNRSLELSLGWSRELTVDQPRLSLRFISDI